MAEITVWGIHGGRTGDADTLFLRRNCVAVGWPLVGDLAKLGKSRDAFKDAVASAYPDKKPNAIPNNAGQLFRFVHEMQMGDLVVYPSKHDRTIHIGRIDGAYKHDPSAEPSYPNTRAVKWLKQFPRRNFTQGALYEVGSAMSLFQVRNYADEFRGALDQTPGPNPPKKDDTVPVVVEEIEETTRDFIIKTLSQELKGHPFAEFVAHLLNAMGYKTRVSEAGPDGGIDIIAHKDELGFEPPIIKVQVKSTDGSVGDPVVSSLYGKVGPNEHGLLVTLGTVTPQAATFAKSKSNLRLIDGEALVGLILNHYDEFDSQYRALLPLKRVYVPQPHIEEEE